LGALTTTRFPLAGALQARHRGTAAAIIISQDRRISVAHSSANECVVPLLKDAQLAA
jgi:hypothetical protein